MPGCRIVVSAATTLPVCSAVTYPLGHFTCANLHLSLSLKTDRAPDTAAALIAHDSAAIPLVTIGAANADVTSNSHADDGAADQGTDCT